MKGFLVPALLAFLCGCAVPRAVVLNVPSRQPQATQMVMADLPVQEHPGPWNDPTRVIACNNGPDNVIVAIDGDNRWFPVEEGKCWKDMFLPFGEHWAEIRRAVSTRFASFPLEPRIVRFTILRSNKSPQVVYVGYN